MANTAVMASTTLCGAESPTLTTHHEEADNGPATSDAELCVAIGIIAAHPKSFWPEAEMEDLLGQLREGDPDATLRAKVIAGIWAALTGNKKPRQNPKSAVECIPKTTVPMRLLSPSVTERLRIV